MARYLLIVDFQPGNTETGMDEWEPAEVTAHLNYYEALGRELIESGERVQSEVLSGPDVAKIVTWDGRSAPVVTDGPFAEFKEWVAGFQVVDVESEERALEIAAKLSAVPGPGGRPIEQPIQVRRIMEDTASLDDWLETAKGAS